MKVKDESKEKLNEAFDLLIKELNDKDNGINAKNRKKLDTVVSKLQIILYDIKYLYMWWFFCKCVSFFIICKNLT